MQRALICAVAVGACIILLLCGIQTAAPQTQAAGGQAVGGMAPRAVFDKYCVTCHNQKLKTAGLTLDTLDVTNPAGHSEIWERVIAKLRAGSMPPPGNPPPEIETYR